MKNKLFWVGLSLLAAAHLALALPAFEYPHRFMVRDSYDYLDLARTLHMYGHYAGTEMPGVDFIRPPGYPLFIYLGLWLTRGGTAIVTLLQVLLSFVTAALLYQTGAEAGSRKVGAAAVLIYLLNPNATFWSLVLLSETLAAFWLALALWAVVRYWRRGGWGLLAAAGLALSAGALTRPIILPLGVVLVLLFAILEWRRRGCPRVAVWPSAVFMLSLFVLVIPWQVRNLVVNDRFTLSVVDRSTFQNWFVAKTLAAVEGTTRDDAVARIASQPDPLRYSLEVVRQYPGVFVKEVARGVFRTLLGAEYGTWAYIFTNIDIETSGVLSILFSGPGSGSLGQAVANVSQNPWFWGGVYALLFDVVMYGLVAGGAWRVLRSYRTGLVGSLFIFLAVSLLYLLVVPGVAGESRFRAPADPLLALAAGLAFLPKNNSQSL